MLSRVASSVYWMTRYLERADNVARCIDVNAHLILDLDLEDADSQWEPQVQITGDVADYEARYDKYNAANVIKFLVFDDANPNSILSCISNTRENARTVREVISSEMWETVNMLYHLVHDYSRKRKIGEIDAFLESIHNANHVFTGHMHNTMSNGEAWQFARMGRYMERADKTARILDMKYFLLLPHAEQVGSIYDNVEWGAVLKSVSGFEMYQKQFHVVNYRDVTDFLILDPEFPRSIRFCVNTAAETLETITRILDVKAPALDAILAMRESLDGIDVKKILSIGLHDFIDGLQTDLNAIDEAIYRSFFSLEKTAKTGQ